MSAGIVSDATIADAQLRACATQHTLDVQALLSVRGLDAFYGQAQILFGIDLHVRPGEVVVLMGRNGAGKSTTMKAIMGLVARRSVELRFAGQDISRLPPFRIARAGLGWVPEDRRVFTELSVLENLDVARRPPRPGAPRWTPQTLFELFPNLGAMPQRAGGRMSGGEQQMLSVARTLMGNPSLVMLDEPSEGVAPVIVEQMARMIIELKTQGLSVLLCEQNLAFASAVGDRAYVLEKGQVRFVGTMAELDADDTVQRHHLAV
jgi:branched-chain amino acid transport system ATP-binding protein